MTVQRVLLVCSGNTCRSPMAAALLQSIWEKANPGWPLTVLSAGTGAFPGLGASEHAVSVLKVRGIDLSHHRSQPVQGALLENVDLVLTMTGRHKEYLLGLWPNLAGRVFTLGEYAGTNLDIPDPFGGAESVYEETAVSLEQVLQAVMERLRKEGSPSNEGGSGL